MKDANGPYREPQDLHIQGNSLKGYLWEMEIDQRIDYFMYGGLTGFGIAGGTLIISCVIGGPVTGISIVIPAAVFAAVNSYGGGVAGNGIFDRKLDRIQEATEGFERRRKKSLEHLLEEGIKQSAELDNPESQAILIDYATYQLHEHHPDEARTAAGRMDIYAKRTLLSRIFREKNLWALEVLSEAYKGFNNPNNPRKWIRDWTIKHAQDMPDTELIQHENLCGEYQITPLLRRIMRENYRRGDHTSAIRTAKRCYVYGEDLMGELIEMNIADGNHETAKYVLLEKFNVSGLTKIPDDRCAYACEKLIKMGEFDAARKLAGRIPRVGLADRVFDWNEPTTKRMLRKIRKAEQSEDPTPYLTFGFGGRE